MKEKAVTGKEKDRPWSYEGMWIRKVEETLKARLLRIGKVSQYGIKIGSALLRYNSTIKEFMDKLMLRCRFPLMNNKIRKMICQLSQLFTLSVSFLVIRSQCMFVECFFLFRRPLCQSLCLFGADVSNSIRFGRSNICIEVSFFFFPSPSLSLDSSVSTSSSSRFLLVMNDFGGYYYCLLPASLSFFLTETYVWSCIRLGRQDIWWEVFSNWSFSSPSLSVISVSISSLWYLWFLHDAGPFLSRFLPISLSFLFMISFCLSGRFLTGCFRPATLSSLTSPLHSLFYFTAIYISEIHLLEFNLDLWLGSSDHHWLQDLRLWVFMGIPTGRWIYDGKEAYCLRGLMNWEGYSAKCSVRIYCRKGKENKDSCIGVEIGVVGWRCGVEYKQESRTICVEEEKVNEIARKKKGSIVWVIYPAIELSVIIDVKWGERITAKLVRIKGGHRRVYNVKIVKVEVCLFEKYTSRVIGGRVGKKLNVLIGVKKATASSSETCKVSTAVMSLNFRMNNGSNKGKKCDEGWVHVSNLHLEDNRKDFYRSEDERRVLFICKVWYILDKENEHVTYVWKRREESRNKQHSRKKGRVNIVWWAEVSVGSLENAIVSKRERCEILEARTTGDKNKYKGKRKVNELWYNMDRYRKNSGQTDYRKKGKVIGNKPVGRNCTKPILSVRFNLVEKNCSGVQMIKASSVFIQIRREAATVWHCSSQICRDRRQEEYGLVRSKHKGYRIRIRRTRLQVNKESVSGWNEVFNNCKCSTVDRRHILIGEINNKVDKHDMDNCRCNIEYTTIVRNEDMEIEYSDTYEIIGILIKTDYNRQLGNITNFKKKIVRMNIRIGNLYESITVVRYCRSRINVRNIDPHSKDKYHWYIIYMKIINPLRWKLSSNIRDWQEVKLINIREKIDLRRWGWKPSLRITHEDQIGPNILNWKEKNKKRERLIKYQNGKEIKRGKLQRVKWDLFRCLNREKKSILVGYLYEKDGRIKYSEEECRNRYKVTDLVTRKNRVYKTVGTGMRSSAYIRIKGDSKSELEFKVTFSEGRADVMIKYLSLRWSRKELAMRIWLSLAEINNDPNRNNVHRNRGRCGRDTKSLQKWMRNVYNIVYNFRISRLMHSLSGSSFPACKSISHMRKTYNTSLDNLLGVILAEECRGNTNRKYKWDATVVALPRLQLLKQYLVKHGVKSYWKTVRNLSINRNLLMIGDVKFDKWKYANVRMREMRCVRRRVADEDLQVCLIRFCCRIRISCSPGTLCSKNKMKRIKVNNIKEKRMFINDFLSYNAKTYWNYLHIRIKANDILWLLNDNYVISYRDSRYNSLRMGTYNVDKTHISDIDIWITDRGDAGTLKRYEKERIDTQGKIEILNENG